MPDAIRIVQIRYSTFAADQARRVFPGPHPVYAIESELSKPDGADGLVVALVPASCEREWKAKHASFLGVESILTINSPKLRVHRRPGRAVLVGDANRFADVLAALVDFEHYDSELRRLEGELDLTEADAERDLPLFFDVRTDEHRSMFAERMTHFSRLRLEFARLEPFWVNPARDLSPRSRAWLAKLLERAETEERAEAVSERLELREELYEGAADRAADAAGWGHGHRLELIIILLLFVEIGFMSVELWLHLHE